MNLFVFFSAPKRAFALVCAVLFAVACRPTQKSDPITVTYNSDGSSANANAAAAPKWAPKVHQYNPSKTRIHDLLHTRLEIAFDWNEAKAMGKANLRLKPYFYATDSLILDAKGFKINELSLVKGRDKTPLKYAYDNAKLRVTLDKTYTRDEEFEVFVDYVASPNELKENGSRAITQAKGLYFINPKGEEPNKPRQLWTQGETESNSCWFPTIESGAERCTQELYITVDDTLQTLSNGTLVSSTKNANGTRTDLWKLDTPHTPYLFMMAVGRFAVVKDKWRNVDVDYYVDPEYEPYARLIFGNTPQMIEFFSKSLGVDYMWPKYSQIIVRDFVSGAMENTTAVTFMEAVQQDRREWLDETYEDIVAHELFHHWFGDYVTCESWANLPLNESFASYGEYLWFEHKYGKDFADEHLDKDRGYYMDEAQGKREPLIRYHYFNREDMFDRHSYQKGACVLHMLRKAVGDEAFYKSLNYYLKTHALTGVEIDELRMAFEDVTGQDMHWFFDQWFMKPGHPELKISYNYNGASNQLEINVKQLQDKRYSPVYELRSQVQIVSGGSSKTIPVTLKTEDTTFVFPVNGKPEFADFDAEKVNLMDAEEEKPLDWWIYQAKNAGNFRQRKVAIERLVMEKETTQTAPVLMALCKNPFFAVRQNAMEALMAIGKTKTPEFSKILAEVALNDPHAPVRLIAMEAIDSTTLTKDEQKALFTKGLADSSYSVCGRALKSLFFLDKEAALNFAQKNKGMKSAKIVGSIAFVLIQADAPDAFDYATQTLDRMDAGWDKINLMRLFSDYLRYIKDAEKVKRGLDYLKNIGANAPQWYMRYWAVYTLHENHGKNAEIQTYISERKRDEKDQRVKDALNKNLK